MEELNNKLEDFRQIIYPKNNRCPIDHCNILSVKGYCSKHRLCIDQIIKDKWKQIYEQINSMNLTENQIRVLTVEILTIDTTKKSMVIDKSYIYKHHINIVRRVSKEYNFNLLFNYFNFKDSIKNNVNNKYHNLDTLLLCVSKYDKNNYNILVKNADLIKKSLLDTYQEIITIKLDSKCHEINNIINNLKYIYNESYNIITNYQSNVKFKDIFRNLIQDNNNIFSCKYIEKETEKYNAKLYEEIKKIEDKFDNIFLLEREKKFFGLNNKNNLRYDIFGGLINKNNCQIYYFIIELDDKNHFNKKNEHDAIKDIYALYNAYSILRIHYNDDINQSILMFIQKIINTGKPIYMLSEHYTKTKSKGIYVDI